MTSTARLASQPDPAREPKPKGFRSRSADAKHEADMLSAPPPTKAQWKTLRTQTRQELATGSSPFPERSIHGSAWEILTDFNGARNGSIERR